jgi:hypothetical protein
MQEQYGEAAIIGLHGSWSVDGENAYPTNRPKLGGIPPNPAWEIVF